MIKDNKKEIPDKSRNNIISNNNKENVSSNIINKNYITKSNNYIPEDIELPIDMVEYLKNTEETKINFKDLDELIYIIRAHTGLETDKIKIILSAFIKEIKDFLIDGKQVALNKLISISVFEFIPKHKLHACRGRIKKALKEILNDNK